jgi:hypothetical protein
MTAEESRAYAKGYAAGRRKVAAERSSAALQRAEDRMWREVFCAALNGLIINANWSIGGEHMATSDDYVQVARALADRAIKKVGHRA